ncbi:hypothetical protein PENTCL1PPCAC_17807, partial [Pristionchus entomophagus]
NMNKEDLILNPIQRMQLLFDSSAITIDTVSDIPIERFVSQMNRMYDLGLSYMEEGQMEKAVVLFLRYVSVNLEVLPNHCIYPYIEWETRKAINQRAHDGMNHTSKIRELLGTLYEEESMRLFNDIVDKSKFGQLTLEMHSNGKTSFGDMVKFIRKMEKEELDRIGMSLGVMPQHEQKVAKTLEIPSDLMDKYNDAVGESDLVGVLLGTNVNTSHGHYYVVSHVLIPGNQHTGWNAEFFYHTIRDSTAPSLGLIPLGLIHTCGDYFVCSRLKRRPAPDGIPSDRYPPAPIDHHEVYSSCPHLFAQYLYQYGQSIAVSIITHDRADNQCVSITSAGRISVARRSLYNGEVTTRADHVKMSDSIQTTVIDLRGTEVEVKLDKSQLVEYEKEYKNNVGNN